jgi:hypothetical protein
VKYRYKDVVKVINPESFYVGFTGKVIYHTTPYVGEKDRSDRYVVELSGAHASVREGELELVRKHEVSA